MCDGVRVGGGVYAPSPMSLAGTQVMNSPMCNNSGMLECSSCQCNQGL